MGIKQIQLITTKDTPSSNNRQNPGNADGMGISGVALCPLALIVESNKIKFLLLQ